MTIYICLLILILLFFITVGVILKADFYKNFKKELNDTETDKIIKFILSRIMLPIILLMNLILIITLTISIFEFTSLFNLLFSLIAAFILLIGVSLIVIFVCNGGFSYDTISERFYFFLVFIYVTNAIIYVVLDAIVLK